MASRGTEIPNSAYPNPDSGSSVRCVCTSINPGKHVPGTSVACAFAGTLTLAAGPKLPILPSAIRMRASFTYLPERTSSNLEQCSAVVYAKADNEQIRERNRHRTTDL